MPYVIQCSRTRSIAFIAFLARLLVGLIVLIVGIYLENLAARVILSTGLAQRRVLALIARVAIIVFAVSMALDQIGVAASHRRTGVARALLEHVIAQARAHGVADLELQTWAFNQVAQSAFRNVGFVPQRARYELHLGAKTPPKA